MYSLGFEDPLGPQEEKYSDKATAISYSAAAGATALLTGAYFQLTESLVMAARAGASSSLYLNSELLSVCGKASEFNICTARSKA